MEVAGSDSIRIEQLEIPTRIGVTDEERGSPQRIVVNLTVWPTTNFGQLRDDIERTIDYSGLCRDTRQFTEDSAYKLIETLASELASHLLEKFPVKALEVEVRKFVLPKTEYVSATVRRARAG